MQGWKVRYGYSRPKLVECDVLVHPGLDSDGDKMFVNTHFADEAAAWEQLMAETLAGVRLAGARLAEQRRVLEKLTDDAARAAEFLAAVLAAKGEADRGETKGPQS